MCSDFPESSKKIWRYLEATQIKTDERERHKYFRHISKVRLMASPWSFSLFLLTFLFDFDFDVDSDFCFDFEFLTVVMLTVILILF